MKLVMGIERPDSGSVKLAGQELAGWSPHQIARAGIGLVFQHSRPLHRQTVLENFKLALLPDSLVRLIAPSGIDEAAREIASRMGLAEVLDRRPAALPFADLRKLELAKTIARDPRVVLVDEPFAGPCALLGHIFLDRQASQASQGKDGGCNRAQWDRAVSRDP